MKSKLFYSIALVVFFGFFFASVLPANGFSASAYVPQLIVEDAAFPKVSAPEYLNDDTLRARRDARVAYTLSPPGFAAERFTDGVQKITFAANRAAQGLRSFFAHIGDDDAVEDRAGLSKPTAAADIITLTSRATRNLLANIASLANEVTVTFPSLNGGSATIVSENKGRFRVTTFRAPLAAVFTPQLTVGEVELPRISIPNYFTQIDTPPRAGFVARQAPAAAGDSRNASLIERLQENIINLLVARERSQKEQAASAPPVADTQFFDAVQAPRVVPKFLTVPQFVNEETFPQAVPAPVTPKPREVIIVERRAIESVEPMREPVSANINAQLGSIASAIEIMSRQRMTDRDGLLKMISDTNNVGRLPSVTLSSPTISGTISGLGDESIPNDISIASTKDITTTGVFTSSSASGTSTLSANFSAGTTTVSGVIRVNGTGATSTFAANIDVDGNLRVGGTCISCGGVSSIAGWTDSGILVELQTTSDLVVIGTSTPVSGAVVTVEATTTGAIPLALRGYTGQAADFFRILNASGNRLMFVSSTGGIFSSSTLQAATTTIYGNLGVGTTSPAEQFSVAGRLYVGGTGTSTFENNLQVLGQLKIGTSSAYITDTQITGTTNFTISTQGENNHLVLQTLGRIGVVSTTPWGVFSVEHNGANEQMPVFVIADQGTSTPTLVVDWAGKIMAGTSTPRGWFTINDRGGADTFVVGSNTPRFIVKGDGNVGVGTSSPYALFSVGGNAALGTTTLYGSLTLGSMSDDPAGPVNGQLYYSTADGAIRAYTNSTWGPLGGGFTRNSSTGIISLFNASDRLTIGTTSPAGLSLITAEATSTAAIPLTLRGYTAQTANLLQIQNSASTNLLFVNASGGVFASSTLQVTGNSLLYGSLGVATTSPGATFAVHGNALIANTLSVANLTATGTITTANLAASASSTIDGLYVRNATTTYATTTDLVVTGRLLVNTASSTITNLTTTNATATVLTVTSIASTSALIVSNTLGVGTSTPAQQLSVAGRLYVGGSGTSTIENNLRIQGTLQTGTGSIFLGSNFLNFNQSSTLNFAAVATATIPQTSHAFTFATSTTATPILAIEGSNFGRVGIGTTSQAAKLAIAGGGLAAESLILANSYGSIMTPVIGSSTGYTVFSGGIGTGGADSIGGAYNNALRITHTGNLVNIGSIQGGELNLTNGGTFAAKVDYTTGTGPRGVAVGDVNGDGKADMAVANFDATTVSILVNNGNGTFVAKTDYTTGTGPTFIALGDVNGDGKADMAVVNRSSNTASVFLNKGDGTFASKVDYTTGSSPWDVALGDLNGDGKADMVVTSYTGAATTLSVLLNNGDGTFAAKTDYTTGTDPTSIALGDVNGDGKADIVVVNQVANTLSILFNNGNGTFAAKTDYATGVTPFGIALGDVNGDGKADIVVASRDSNTASVFLNKGDGTFASKVDYTTGTGPFTIVLGDVNGDGKADIVVTNWNSGTGVTISVLLNNGDGTFAAKTDYTTGTAPYGIALGDVNGDGKADIVVANNGASTASVLLNNATGMIVAKALTGNVGVGTSTPSGRLTIWGSGTGAGNAFIISDSASTTRFLVQDNGLVGIGTTTPGALLSIHGNALVSNTLSVANLTATGTVTLANLAASASSTIDGLYVRLATTTYATTTDLVVTGRLLANTASSTITNLTTTNATATVLTVSSIASTSALIVSNNLGIGTTTPTQQLSVAGRLYVGGSGTSTIENNFGVLGNLSVGNVCINCGGGGGFDGGTTTVTNLIVSNMSTSTFAGGLAVQTNRLVISQVTGAVGVGTTTPTQAFAVQGNALISGNIASVANLTATGTIIQNAFAYTALTAATEKNDVNLNLARTVQFTAGNLATQRAVLVSAPTYAFTASSTLTDASTFLITGAPIAGAFNLATSTYALKIDGATSVQGATTLIPTNAYSLYIAPPTGATNNYALIVTGGASGFGTTTPSATLAVQGNALISGNIASVANLTATGTVTTANLAASASSTIDSLYVRNATTTYATTTMLAVQDLASTSRLTVSSSFISTAAGTSTFAGPIAAGASSDGKLIVSGATSTSNILLAPYGGTAIFGGGYASTTLPSSASTTALYIPTHRPRIVGSVATGQNLRDIYIQDTYAYLITDAGTFLVYSIASTTPSLVASASVGLGLSSSIYAQGRYAYVVDFGNDQLRIIDISNPRTPTSVGVVTTGVDPRSVYVQGRYAYVAAGAGNTFEVYDVSNPASIALVGSISGISTAYGIFVKGRYAYVTAFGGDTLYVIDVSNPTAPVTAGSVGTGVQPTNLFVQGRYAYVANFGGDTLQIFDISNPASPVSIATIGTADAPVGVEVRNRFAYVSTLAAMQVFDISNPASPIEVATIATGGATFSTLDVSGRTAYVANFGGLTLHVIDLGGAYIQQLAVGGLEVETLQLHTNATIGNDLDVMGGLTVGKSVMFNGAFSVLTTSGLATTTAFTVNPNGRVGVSTTTPGTTLSVHGNALISNTLSIANLVATGTITTANLAASASSTIDGLYVRLATTTYATTTDLVVTGRLLANTASSTITNLTTTNATATVLTVSSIASTSALVVSTTLTSNAAGTSTFAGGASIYGIATANGLTITSGAITNTASATSTFTGGISTGGLSSTNGLIISGGSLGVGTTSPYARLSITGASGSTQPLFVVASSSNATEYFSISSTGTTTIQTLQTGAMTFETNAGVVTWVDLPVSSSAAQQTVESYSAQLDTNDVLTIYGESDGSGGVWRPSVGIGSSTPWGIFSVEHGSIPTSSPVFVIADQGTSSPSFIVMNTNGFVGVATATPGSRFSVHGNALVSNNLLTANLTATGTVTTANLAASASSTIDGLYVRLATTTYATTTDLVVTGRLLANTASSTITNLTTTNATATVLTVSDIASTSRLVVSTPITVNGAGTSTFAGGLAVQTNRLVISQVTGTVGVGTTTPTQAFAVQGNLLISGNLTSVADVTATGTIQQNAFAYTALTASTEKNDVNLNLARTVQFTAGALATQRAVLVQAPTYAFTASSTLTDASTLLITGAPIAGAFNRATSTYALKIDGGTSVQGATTLIPTNAYALYIAPPTGATNNYALIITGGASGFGTTSPSATLAVQGNALISGNITSVAGITATGTITTANLVASASSTIDGLYVRLATTTYATTTDLVVTGRLLANTASSTITNLTTTNATATVLTVSDIASTSRLVVSGSFTSTVSATSTFTGGVSAAGLASSNGLTLSGGALLASSALGIFQYLGISTSTPSATLGVHGNALISGNITSVANFTATGTVTAANLAASASSTIDGLYVRLATTTYATTTDLVVTGRLLANTASSTITNLTTTNATATVLTVSDLASTSRLTVSSAFTSTVSGTSTFAGGVSTEGLASSNGLTLSGGALFASSALGILQYLGVSTTSPATTLAVQGNVLISGNIASVAGITATGTITTANLVASASSTIDGLYVRLATTTYATTTDLVVTGRLLANTASSTITNLTTTNATATVLTVTSIASTSNLIVSNNLGVGTSTPTEQLSVAQRLYVGGSGTSTIENNFLVRGNLQVGGSSIVLANNAISGSTNLTIQTTGATTDLLLLPTRSVGIGTSTPATTLAIQGNLLLSGNLTSVADLIATGTIQHNAFAYTALTAATERTDVNLNLARTVEFAAGDLATQRAVLISAPTYAFTASSTLTDASTLLITGAPIAGAFNRATSTYALKIDGGTSVDGATTLIPTNAYSLYIAPPTGATNNYPLIITGGSIGFGTTSPSATLAVQGNVLISGNIASVANLTATGTVGVGTSTPWGMLSVNPNGISGPAFAIGSSTQTNFVVTNGGIVGIGTTSPYARFAIEQQASDSFVFAVGDQGTSSPHLVVAGNGYVGIGTSSPWSALSIEGRCVDTGAGCADFAELYTSSEPVMPGEIVSADATAVATVRKARLGDAVIGIVSSAPAITIEGSSLQFLSGVNYRHQSERPAIALSGRVPVKVSTEGGAIRVGDRIALSSISGVGMRATTSGMTVGVAIEAFDGSMSLTTDVVNGKEVRLGRATVFVNLSYAPLGELARAESIGLIGPISQISPIDYIAQALSAMQNWLTQMGVVIEQSLIKVKEIVVDFLTAKKISVEQLQMKDKFTGEAYCVELVNGDLVRTKGECAEPNTTVNSVPTPDQSAPLENTQGSPSINSGTNDFSATTTATTTSETQQTPATSTGEATTTATSTTGTATVTEESAVTTTPETQPTPAALAPVGESVATSTEEIASSTQETQ